MIEIETLEANGIIPALHGMRNPKNSWHLGDSYYKLEDGEELSLISVVGDNDRDLATRLANGGPVHAKYRRMITVYADITAPMYWWAEFDTYKVGTVRNSCSKMHKLLAKPFEMKDFSFDKLQYAEKVNVYEDVARPLIDVLNELRDSCLSCTDEKTKKSIWYSILQLLPESYNQRSTVMLNYETLANICEYRAGHKLDEWHSFIDWAKGLPCSWMFLKGGET